jgi:hypothetical protein
MVGLGEIAVDGGLEVDDRAEHTTFQPALPSPLSSTISARQTCF